MSHWVRVSSISAPHLQHIPEQKSDTVTTQEMKTNDYFMNLEDYDSKMDILPQSYGFTLPNGGRYRSYRAYRGYGGYGGYGGSTTATSASTVTSSSVSVNSDVLERKSNDHDLIASTSPMGNYYNIGNNNNNNNNNNTNLSDYLVGPGIASAAADITFMEQNRYNHGLAMCYGNGDIVFTNRLKKRGGKWRKKVLDYKPKKTVKDLQKLIISDNEAFNFINTFIGPKERYSLILGELDFSFSLSIIRKLGNQHNVITTSLHNSKNMRRLYGNSIVEIINNNINEISKFSTNYDNSSTIVCRDFDGLKIRESLVNNFGNDIGNNIVFDKVIFAMPFAATSNQFDIRNSAFIKRLLQNMNIVVNRNDSNVKPEFHLLMPIFKKKSQFESFKIEQLGKDVSLKWRLKTIKIFDVDTLPIAFNGYAPRTDSGKFAQDFPFLGYYIMETI